MTKEERAKAEQEWKEKIRKERIKSEVEQRYNTIDAFVVVLAYSCGENKWERAFLEYWSDEVLDCDCNMDIAEENKRRAYDWLENDLLNNNSKGYEELIEVAKEAVKESKFIRRYL